MAPRLQLVGWIVSLAAVAVSALGTAQAQDLSEGWTKLDGPSIRARGHLLNILKGAEKFSAEDKSQVEAVDLVAKRHAYGIVLNHDMMKPGKIEVDMKDFDGYIQAIVTSKDREALQPLTDVFRDKVRIHALEIIASKETRSIHKIHNARLLAKVAVLGQGALADTLLSILKDPSQNDGVRYYILRALATLLAQVQPGTTKQVLTKDEQTKCAEALVEFLEQRKGPSKKAPPEEIDGFRVLRREAIRALAQIHIPAINDKVRPALVLARFGGNDERIQPPPRIDERVEASLGLARMQSAQDKLYQPDYAAGQIAKCLGLFGQMAKNERANKEKPQTRPWAIDATLLSEAMDSLKADSGKNAYVAQTMDRAKRLLNDVITNRDIDANELTWWNSPESDPPSKELFQGAADSTVKQAPPGDDSTDK